MGGKHRGEQLHPKEFKAWENMKLRCYSPNATGYSNYGGRGIKVCERWRNSFWDFLTDVGNAVTPKHTLDRIDVNGNYEPGNCRWATRTEQMRNTRLTTMYKGEPLADIADRENINRKTAHQRVAKGQDPVNPVLKNRKRLGISEASRETGIPYSTLANRMKRNGLTLEEAKRGTKK